MASDGAEAAPGSGERGSSTPHPAHPPLPVVHVRIQPALGTDSSSSSIPKDVAASSFVYTSCYWLVRPRRAGTYSPSFLRHSLNVLASGEGASSLAGSTSFFSEENVYFLCKQLSLLGIADYEGQDLFVVFIFNGEKQIPLWHQRASKRIDGLVVWDYHVICIQSRRVEGDIHHIVWDLDSTLPLPLPLNRYVVETFQSLPSSYHMPDRYFRVIHAPIYLRYFASDRTHMKDHAGNWISPPPTYSTIVAEDGAINNIDEYIQICAVDIADMAELVRSLFTRKLGAVVNEVQLLELFERIAIM